MSVYCFLYFLACLYLLTTFFILFISVLTAGYLDTFLNPQYPLVSEKKAEGYHPPPDSHTITPDHGLDYNREGNFLRLYQPLARTYLTCFVDRVVSFEALNTFFTFSNHWLQFNSFYATIRVHF